MLMNALLLNLLLTKPDKEVTGLRLDNEAQKGVVTAYADDVTIILTDTKDIRLLQNILYTYEQATGTETKSNISKALLSGRLMYWVSPIHRSKDFRNYVSPGDKQKRGRQHFILSSA
jgi:hypothetical protein